MEDPELRVTATFVLQKSPIGPSSLVSAKSLEVRRGYEIITAIDPHDGREWDVRVSHARMKSVAARGAGQAKELAFTVPEILRYPSAIFQGVREDGEKDWLCYCGVPHRGYYADGRERAPYLGEVFLVFVNADRVAYNQRWEKADTDKSTFPNDYNNRFGKWVL